MSDNKFWLRVWAFITIIICTIVIGVSWYHINYTNISLEMIKQGIAPEAVQCALSDTWGRNPVCIVLAGK